MLTVLGELAPGAGVAVLRLRSLGDCVLTTPALEILHRFRPDLRVAVVLEERFAAVLEGNPAVAAVLPPRVRAVRRWRAELCLNLHGGTRSLLLMLASGARYRAGFGHFRYQCLYHLRIPRAQQILGEERKVHTAEHLASAIFYLGAPLGEIPPARLYAKPTSGARPYAVLHPVASTPDKTWPVERFLDVARRIEPALDPVFIGAPGENLSAFGRYLVMQGAPLSEVKSLLAGAALFIGNDSGPAHMAAAFRVPSVVLFGGSDAGIWGPWRAPSEVLAPQGGIRAIQVADVVAALGRLRVPA